MRLDGKVALVTGAGQGIGQSIAVRLAEEGERRAVGAIRRVVVQLFPPGFGKLRMQTVGDGSVSRTTERSFHRQPAPVDRSRQRFVLKATGAPLDRHTAATAD